MVPRLLVMLLALDACAATRPTLHLNGRFWYDPDELDDDKQDYRRHEEDIETWNNFDQYDDDDEQGQSYRVQEGPLDSLIMVEKREPIEAVAEHSSEQPHERSNEIEVGTSKEATTAGQVTPTAVEEPPTTKETPTVEETPSAGEGTPTAGKETPAAGEKTPTVEETPSAEEGTPTAGEGTPTAGEETPTAGEETPTAGEKTPTVGQETPTAGKETPTDEKPGKTGSTVKPSSSSLPMWIFRRENWEEKVKGELVAGTEFEIVYDGARLPGRDMKYGRRAWDIYAEFMFNDNGDVHKTKLDGPEMIEGLEIMTKKIFIPFGTNLITIWFVHWGYFSGYTYDSDYEKNYKHRVAMPNETTIVFDRHWGETVYGALERSGRFVVKFDEARLGKGNVVFSVVKYSEHENETYTREMSGPEHGYLTSSYVIPELANQVIMWFYTGTGANRRYDSNYGQNYNFKIKTN